MENRIHLPLITVSRARSFRRCARHHFHAYEQGYRSIETSGALAFGTLWHLALEQWWLADRDGEAALLAACEVIDLAQGVDPFTRVILEELLLGYSAMWSGAPLEAQRVEAEFLDDLKNPKTGAASRTFRRAGKIDVIALRDGACWIIEHKTTSEDISPGSPYWQKLRLDAQVSTYLDGARSLGFDPMGCIYDVVAKPSLRPAKATPLEAQKRTQNGRLYASQRADDETPEEFRERLREHIATHPERYFGRGEVVRLDDEANEAAWDLWQTARAIRDAELEERWPRNPEACFFWNRPCEYFPVCTGSEAIETSSRYRKIETPHEELTHVGKLTPA